VSFRLRPAPGALPDLELGEMIDEPLPQRPSRAQTRAAIEASETPRADPGGGSGGLFDQFGGQRAPTAPLQALLSQLDKAEDAYTLSGVLDDLVTIAEGAAREGKATLVGDILSRITKREGQVEEAEAKRSFAMPLRRLAKPPLMRAVATQLPHAGERRDDLIAVLARAGEDGADAVVEQLATVAAQSDRRAYFDALLKLQAGIPTLIHMLGDQRWFVARNAADLLGEMQAREAEQPLTGLLRHDDDRVRRAATGALMRLGTPKALQAIQEALKSDAPQMRMQAAAALVTRKDVRTAATLVRALDEEKDEEVQAAFLFALGKLATADAVQRLLEAVKPEKGLFKKKPTAYRVAAVQGLAEARTAEAMAVLKELALDKDEDIRDAANFALGRIARATR
jgi:HEAT repeat protein